MIDELFWDREQLYRRVWAKPLTKLGPDYGVSATALWKVCKKLHVPLPGRGHWSKSTQARPSIRPPLPHLKGFFVVRRRKELSNINVAAAEPFAPTSRLRAPRKALINPDFEPGRLVAESALRLRKAPVDDRGIIRARSNEACLDLRVSKAELGRALTISSRLLELLKLEGIRVSVELRDRAITKARVFEHEIQFAVLERTRKTGLEHRLDGRAETTLTSCSRSRCTGRLAIQVLECGADGLRKRWSDGDKHRLEDLLPCCVSGFKALARSLQIAAAERASKEQNALCEKRGRRNFGRVTEGKPRKLHDLTIAAEKWSRAQLLREFIQAVERTASRIALPIVDGPIENWIEWAREQADKLDPLASNSGLLADRKPALRRRRKPVRDRVVSN
jgi:hypothetical protein